jgi:hypothetical protein
MSRFPLKGGCFCGAVRYELLAPALSLQHCHCGRCRKLTGTFMASGAVIRKSDLRITGEENLARFRSSPSLEGCVCKTCHSSLFGYEDSEPELMYLSPGSLDDGAHPGHPKDKESHIYVRSKASWEIIADGLPQYETTSPDEIITEIQRQSGDVKS